MIIDILVIIVILISIIIAFLRGFIREVLTIFGVAGGAAASFFGGPHLSPYMREWMGVIDGEEPEKLFGIFSFALISDALSYISIFIVVVIALSIFSHVLAEFAKNIGLGALDRTLGIIFGFVRGAFILSLLYLPFYAVMDQESKETFFEGSKSHFYLEQATSWLSKAFPEDMMNNFDPNSDDGELKNAAREKLKEMDVLNEDGTLSDKAENYIQEQTGGYSDQFRDEMNQLMKRQQEQGTDFGEEE